MIEGLSEAMSAALVGNKSLLDPLKISFHMSTHATELVLDRPGFSETFDLLDSSKWSRR